ncbi:MAG: riboflavin kinase [Candidatus Pacebacteria bacterium]|nr:riboflavin kinase [Candidatus Paceibacterota bacterium]
MNSIIKGKVIKGDGYGKKIGYPTINIDRRNFLSLKDRPDFGVYAGVVELGNKKYRAGIIIGPLDKKGKPKVEAHLLNYKGSAYGKKATLFLKKFIREFKHFKTEKELIAQIGKDLNKC